VVAVTEGNAAAETGGTRPFGTVNYVWSGRWRAVDTGAAGAGLRAVLLLHGFPETHLMWRDVAPVLARRFTVVCPDLRGRGQPIDPGHFFPEEMPRRCAEKLKAFLTPNR
jgi:pimeloyl-ACP methyl ester carboxylesterase